MRLRSLKSDHLISALADETVKGGSENRSFEQGHGTPKGDVASANKDARTLVGYLVAVRRGGKG